MSSSLRFIGLALAAWVGIRAVSLGVVPGAEALAFDAPPAPADSAAVAIPPVATTEFAPLDPVAPAPMPGQPGPPPMSYAPTQIPVPVPIYRYASFSAPVSSYGQSAAPRVRPLLALGDVGDWSLDADAVARYAQPQTPLDQWPVTAFSSGRRTASTEQSPALQVRRLDRLSMSAWAMLRREPGGTALAANGMLGGSQAGARILYRFTPSLAASLRTSAPVGGTVRSGEIAGGIRWQPIARMPVAITAERRQAVGRDAGRSDFALFAEAGLYQRPIMAAFNLDAYLQAGIVGVGRRDLFVDGSATFTRPLWGQVSGGFGLWGGAQPGLYRIDAGPRLSWRVGRSMRVHADYRQRLAGSAAPGSGPVLTLAGDF